MAVETYYSETDVCQPEIEVYYTTKAESTNAPPQVIEFVSPDFCWSRYYSYSSTKHVYTYHSAWPFRSPKESWSSSLSYEITDARHVNQQEHN